jgi:serine/threonine-protein kinase HipA
MVKYDTLYINMNGIRVGRLERSGSGAMSFRYDEQWLSRPEARPVSLSLPMTVTAYRGPEVYNFFDNLLPDSDLIRGRIQRRFNVSTSHPYDLLAAVGQDCVGALQLTTDSTLPDITGTICTPLDDGQIAAILKQYAVAPLGMTGDIDDFRISLAGVQEKTAFTWWNETWCRPHGITPTTHIFKRPIGLIEHAGLDLGDSCENELLCLKIIGAYGIPVADAQMARFQDEKCLVVKRFDRKTAGGGGYLLRLPQEDMCQAMGYSPGIKYENDGGPGIRHIMNLLLSSRLADTDRRTFMMSQVVFWLLAAIDGHAKNFSIFLEANNRFRLTPLYDILSAYPWFKTGVLTSHKAKMAMALQGKNAHYKWSSIAWRHFPATAKIAGYSPVLMEEMLNQVTAATERVLEAVQKQLPKDFPVHISEPVLEGVSRASSVLSKG